MKKHELQKVPQYRRFVDERDKALEKLHRDANSKLSDILRAFLNHTVTVIAGNYVRLRPESGLTAAAKNALKQAEREIDLAVNNYAPQMVAVVDDLRTQSYLLAKASEGEAIARGTGKTVKIDVSVLDLIDEAESKTSLGEIPTDRATLALDRIKRKAIDAMQLSIVHEEAVEPTIERVIATFPKSRKVRRPKRALKPLKEAKALVTGVITDEMWTKLVNQYLDEYVPVNRGPSSVVDVDIGELELEEIYTWELEQMLTDEFVAKVRKGQIDAAKENKIEDFVWIAVIDARTDDCCKWRDGLLLSEIKSKLKAGHEDFGCPGEVPPLHPNCRCRIAPAIEDMPEPEPSRMGSFLEWLEQ